VKCKQKQQFFSISDTIVAIGMGDKLKELKQRSQKRRQLLAQQASVFLCVSVPCLL